MEALKMKKLFTLVLAIIITLSIVACGNNLDKQPLEEPKEEQTAGKQEQSTENSNVEELLVEQSKVDAFIERYNTTAPTPITDVVEVDITDKESGHYRTEFRLGSFKGSITKTGKIGDIVIDIVNCGWQKDELRIYADGITPEQAGEVVKYAAPIMDSNVSSEELQDVLDYLSGANDYHNGYFGELCMTFNEIYGQLMLRTD